MNPALPVPPLRDAAAEALLTRLQRAVQSRSEGHVLAAHAAALTGRPCVVLLRRADVFRVYGTFGITMPPEGSLPEGITPEAWLAVGTGCDRWTRQDLLHGRRTVGMLLLGGRGEGSPALDAACARAAPFFAALGTREPPPSTLELHLAQIVHDLRQPLGSLNLSIQLLEERALADPAQLRRCRRSMRQLRDLVEDLLTLAAPSKQAAADVPLAEVVSEVVEDLEERARQRHVRAILLLEAEPRLRGAWLSLRRAITNVVANAVEIAPEGTVVEVRVRELAGSAIVEVRDEGAGVPPELREKVFEPFYSSRPGGTGLGLAVSRMVAEAHRGTVRFVDGPGASGAVVRFEFPLAMARNDS